MQHCHVLRGRLPMGRACFITSPNRQPRAQSWACTTCQRSGENRDLPRMLLPKSCLRCVYAHVQLCHAHHVCTVSDIVISPKHLRTWHGMAWHSYQGSTLRFRALERMPYIVWGARASASGWAGQSRCADMVDAMRSIETVAMALHAPKEQG